jgi:PKD repeat protein
VNPPSPNDHEVTLFDASTSKSTNGPIASYVWNFGDGGTASGITAQHSYDTPGTFIARLTVTDVIGATNFVSQGVTVGQGQLPTATFVVSPAPPIIIGQTVNFNASGSTAAPGHVITVFAWNFGDGTLDSSGALVTHSYTAPGSYVVTLKVTDDAGRKSLLFTLPVQVNPDTPTARFTVTPSAPTAPSGKVASVFFDGRTSTAAPGRTIVSYSWRASNGLTGLGQFNGFSGDFLAPGVYTMTLTVTDDAGKTDTTVQVFVVSAT